jgi:hypothetical protein
MFLHMCANGGALQTEGSPLEIHYKMLPASRAIMSKAMDVEAASRAIMSKAMGVEAASRAINCLRRPPDVEGDADGR